MGDAAGVKVSLAAVLTMQWLKQQKRTSMKQGALVVDPGRAQSEA